MPLISVITVCKNAGSALEDSISSLRTQTFTDFEFIIVDGKSEDHTKDIVAKNKDLISLIISEADSGIYDAMNKGITISSGAYIYFLNAGDVFYSNDTLKRISDFLKPGSPVIVYGDVLMVSKDQASNKILMHKDYDFISLLRRPVNHQGIFASRLVFERNGLFDVAYRIRGDHDWELRNFKDKNIVFRYIPVIVARYKDEGFTTRNKVLYGIKERKMLIRKNISFFGISLYRIFSPIGLIERWGWLRKFINYIL